MIFIFISDGWFVHSVSCPTLLQILDCPLCTKHGGNYKAPWASQRGGSSHCIAKNRKNGEGEGELTTFLFLLFKLWCPEVSRPDPLITDRWTERVVNPSMRNLLLCVSEGDHYYNHSSSRVFYRMEPVRCWRRWYRVTSVWPSRFFRKHVIQSSFP